MAPRARPNLNTAYLTENFTYLTTSGYTSRYMFNRMTSSPTTTISYDQCVNNGGETGTGNEWDPNTVWPPGLPSTIVGPSGTTSLCYDNYGNVTSTTVNGISGSVSTSSATNYAAPESMSVGTLSTSNTYSSFLGLTNETGPNGTSVSLGYDAMARPTTSTSPFGATTTTTYNDTASPPTTKTTVDGRWTMTTLDGLGRSILVSSGDSSNTYSQAESVYGSCGCSPLGKLIQQAVAHAPGTMPAYTTYTYDGIGRTIAVQAPDGASTTHYSYQGNTVTVTDPAGNWKTYTTDALGNLVQVTEPNPAGGSNLITAYSYDLIQGHLTGVSMTRGMTTQTRTFTYSGAYLVSATNPENGTVNYTYNSQKQLTKRVDAKNQEVDYTYDSYGRVTEVQRYPVSGGSEDTCQRENYYYDSNPFGGSFSNYTAGRLAAVQYRGVNTGSGCSATFQEWYNYNVPGATVGKRLRTAQPSWTTDLTATFAYDTEGRMTSVNYPTDVLGNTASYATTFDTMGRPYSLTDQVTSDTLIQSASYGPANELTRLSGNGYSYSFPGETRSYNAMKQLTQINADYGSVALTYNYSATSNNGKITSQQDGVSGETVNYQYDSLNRLASASAGSWSQGFSYDGFGNLTSVSGTNANSFTIDPATNHAPCSDANGNADEVHCAGSYNGYTYDVENRIAVTPSSAPGGTMHYSYAPGNRRVWRGNGSSTNEVTFYAPNGQRLGVYTLNNGLSTIRKDVYFGGRLMGNGTLGGWIFPDRLGSNGEYYPYGADKNAPPNDREKFTGYERDADTGNDYAVNRYMQPGSGRFMSPDPDKASGGPSDPGSWNRYAYVGGDPINRSDPAGTCWQDPVTGNYIDGDPANNPGPDSGFVLVFDGPCNQGGGVQAQGSSVTVTDTVDPVSTQPDGTSLDLLSLAIMPSTSSTPGGGSGASSGGTGLFPGIRSKGQTFGDCMRQHEAEYSFAAAVSSIYEWRIGSSLPGWMQTALSAAAGNVINDLLLGGGKNSLVAAGTTVLPAGVAAGMGAVTSYGRRTATISSLNISGSGCACPLE